MEKYLQQQHTCMDPASVGVELFWFNHANGTPSQLSLSLCEHNLAANKIVEDLLFYWVRLP